VWEAREFLLKQDMNEILDDTRKVASKTIQLLRSGATGKPSGSLSDQ